MFVAGRSRYDPVAAHAVSATPALFCNRDAPLQPAANLSRMFSKRYTSPVKRSRGWQKYKTTWLAMDFAVDLRIGAENRDSHGAGEWPESYAVTSGLWESENGPSKGEDRYHAPDGLAVKRSSTKGIDCRGHAHEDT